jgi:hypothetical protein
MVVVSMVSCSPTSSSKHGGKTKKELEAAGN